MAQIAMMHSNQYTFGDNDLAARRLRLLAAAFEPTSARLLRPLASMSPRHAVDLGCGPGWTTRLVHAIIGPASTMGLDASTSHIERARDHAPPGVRYAVHEIQNVPFPGPRPNLLYCRFLLVHLAEPERVLSAWAEAAAPGALLAVEETAALRSDHPSFARYYDMVAALQGHHGQDTYLGQKLDAAPANSGWRTELATLRPVCIPAADMARLHVMNLPALRADPFLRDQHKADELDALAARLDDIARGQEKAPPVTCLMRQLVLSKP